MGIAKRDGATEAELIELTAAIEDQKTWETWIEERATAEKIRKSTISVWRSNLRFLAEFVGTPYLQNVSREEAIAYKAQLLKRMQPQTAKKTIRNLTGFWLWAMANGQAETNIWEGLTRKMANSAKKPLPPEEVVRAGDQKAAEKQDFAYLIMRYTGCRSNEANGLRHCDIDLENKTINFVEWQGHGIKRWLKGGDKDERVVPINSTLFTHLKKLELDGSDKPIWPRQYKPKTETFGNSWASDFKHKYHDGEPGYTSHDLRRWILTHLALANVSPFIIYEITRQRTEGMSKVISLYVRPSLEQVREVMEKFCEI